MGHLTAKGTYRKLRDRLDKNPVGAPDHPALYEILSLLFTPEEAEIATRMPMAFSSTGRLARILKRPATELQPILDRMAEKGLLFDLDRDGKSYWYLNPLVIGFFEFTMMRVREDIDQKAVARKMYDFLFDDPDQSFLKEVALGGETQLFRPLVHENALPDDYTEVLDYERASKLVSEAGFWSVGLCHCRHVAEHREVPCRNTVGGRDNPMEVCLTLGLPAKTLVRRGIAREIDRTEALEILEGARAAGLVQLGDNVQNRASFICNCCKCCCELLEGYRRLGDFHLVQTSNFIAQVDHADCTRCGVCVKACPVNALELVAATGDVPTGPGRSKAAREKELVLAEEVCLGCGVCATKCSRDAMHMVPRPQRVHTPETTLERVVRMALERGKLQNLLFDDPDNLTHEVLRRFVGILLSLPPARQLLAREQLRSRFVNLILKGAATRPGATDV